MTSTEELLHGIAVLRPTVKVGAGRTPLPAAAQDRLIRVVVDTSLRLPDMFELTFVDRAGTVLDDAGLQLGTELEIRGGAKDEQQDWSLVVGEVTAMEGSYDDAVSLTIVRGYSHDHRLQRARRVRTFVDVTDSDVARQLAGGAGLTVGQVEATTQVHPNLVQADQTDWEFLTERAAEIGCELGARDGRFYYRKARTVTDGPPLAVELGEQLRRFRPRVSAANLVGEVEARVQDPTEAKAIAVRVPVATATVDIGAGTAASSAGRFAPRAAPAAAVSPAASSAASAAAGPAPTTNGQLALDRGLAVNAGSDGAVKATADALAEHASSGFAEAEGELLGDARVIAGSVLQVGGVPAQFAGKWLVTTARHVFDTNDGGYRTQFAVSGRQDRSLLALAARSGPSLKRIDGVVCGVVTDVADPLDLGRVKLMLPWLSPDYESAWAPVSQLFAAAQGGALFVPGPNEQVLVAFEHGDVRRPYVLGSLVNNRTGAGARLDGSPSAKPGATAVKAGQPPAVIRRGFASPTGSRVVFHDEAPPAGGRPTAAQVIVATGQDKIGIVMDQVAGTLTINCAPGQPPGTLKIQCDGNVEIAAGATGTLAIDGGSQLSLKAKAIEIQAELAVAVKGKPIQLN